MANNLYDHINPNICPPNLTIMCGVLLINEHPYNTKDSLKATIVRVMSDMNKEQLIKACNQFRPRIQAVIDACGRFIE